jgi:hypothetical protein
MMENCEFISIKPIQPIFCSYPDKAIFILIYIIYDIIGEPFAGIIIVCGNDLQLKKGKKEYKK